MASLVKRGSTFYLQDRLSGKLKRWSLDTDALQVAKEKLRRYESAKLQGIDSPLPTRTPVPEVLEAYVEHIRSRKTAKSAQTDVYYLREAFGPVCPALCITSRKVTLQNRKRPPLDAIAQDKRRRPLVIEAPCLEQITTAQIAAFIDGQVKSRGLAAKTANRYREILCRLFNWSMQTGRVRMPSNLNPAAKVIRYKERAPEIRYLTLAQIDEQLHGLRFNPKLQTMVAVLIYAGLRREELLWLTVDDVDLTRRHGGHGLIRVRAKTIAGESWQPKTKVNRAVPISQALRGYLDRYTPQASDHGWYFPSPQGTRWDPDNFSADLREANSAIGLKWGCLDYRHTFGSQLAQNNISLFKVAALLGNSPEVCRRHYAAFESQHAFADVDFPTPSGDSINLERRQVSPRSI